MNNQKTSQTPIVIVILVILFALVFTSCTTDKSKKYQYAEIYLNCENYSTTQNDPGNCLVIEGTTDGLRIQTGMVVSEKDTISLMKSLGWKKDSQTTKYIDVNGQSYKVDVFKFSRVLEQ